jgi:hypothetical protein
MAFFKELRRRRRVAKWRKMRVRMARLNERIFDTETELIDADPDEVYDLTQLLSAQRRMRNDTLRSLQRLETKERLDVQA